jgi:hypothetical protein
MTTETAYLILIGGAILARLVGLMLTRMHWRDDIAPYSRGTKFLDVTLHPERYVKGAPLRTIWILNVAGALLLAGAVVVLVYEFFR